MSIRCGHCQERHETVAEVHECAQHAHTHNMAAAGYVSRDEEPLTTATTYADLNVDWHDNPALRPARKAAAPAQPVSPGRVPSGYRAVGTNHGAHGGPLTKKRAAEGMYRKAGTIYKVQKAVHGSGQNYAKRLVETLVLDRKTGKPKWKFEYAPGFVFELRSEHALTIEQAKEFGALYGTCCVCGRTLTKEESIEAGIGPICAEKF